MSAHREFVRVLQEGESLETFLERMRPRLKQLLANCRVPPVDAEDVLQDTFLTLLTKWESIRHKEAWLISTLRFRCAVYWKRVQEDPLVAMDPSVVETFSEPLAPDQDRDHLLRDFRTALRWVGKRDRALLWLHIGMGVPLVEVAERLGYRPSGIRKLKLRATARLEKALSRRSHEPTRRNDDSGEAGGRRSPRQVPSGARRRRPKFTEGVRMSAKQALVHAIQSEMASQGIGRRILAGRLGCTEEAIAQMLDGRRPGMRLNTAEKLAKALGRRLFLALIPETSLETTFTLPPDVAERVDSEASRQNIPINEFALQLIVKALEIQETTALRISEP